MVWSKIGKLASFSWWFVDDDLNWILHCSLIHNFVCTEYWWTVVIIYFDNISARFQILKLYYQKGEVHLQGKHLNNSVHIHKKWRDWSSNQKLQSCLSLAFGILRKRETASWDLIISEVFTFNLVELNLKMRIIFFEFSSPSQSIKSANTSETAD